MPRSRSFFSTPARFSAVRSPATAFSAEARAPERRARELSFLPEKLQFVFFANRAPATSVPVTTVPKPFMVKTRSMGRRAMALESRGGS